MTVLGSITSYDVQIHSQRHSAFAQGVNYKFMPRRYSHTKMCEFIFQRTPREWAGRGRENSGEGRKRPNHAGVGTEHNFIYYLIYLKGTESRLGKGEVFHLLVHSSNTHNSQKWDRPEPGVQNSTHSSPMGGMASSS